VYFNNDETIPVSPTGLWQALAGAIVKQPHNHNTATAYSSNLVIMNTKSSSSEVVTMSGSSGKRMLEIDMSVCALEPKKRMRTAATWAQAMSSLSLKALEAPTPQRKKRMIRFACDSKDESSDTTCRHVPERSCSSRQRLLVQRRRNKMLHQKMGIDYNDKWLSSNELKQLQLQCVNDVRNLEKTKDGSSPEDHTDVLSLSRFLPCRREKKSVVQRQLLDTIRAIQEYQNIINGESGRGDCSELIASVCSRYSQTCRELSHVEGLCLRLEIV
jgi:hypothetical protein